MAEMTYRNPFAAHRNVGIPFLDQRWEGQRFEDEDWVTMTFHNCVFDGVTLAGVDLEQTNFVRCRFDSCVLEECNLESTRWTQCTGAGFRVVGESVCERATVSQCEFDRLHFEQPGDQMVLADSKIGELHFDGNGRVQTILTVSDVETDLLSAPEAEWQDGSFVRIHLARWAIGGASFARCSFVEARGEGVDLSDVAFAECNLHKTRLAGARLLRAERCVFAESDLTEADLRDAEASGSLFAKANARRCRFDGANMEGALFPQTDLVEASFVGTAARASIWAEADLTDANLERLSARESSFRNVCLEGATLLGADLRDTDLHGVQGDLSVADTHGSRGTVEWRAERERELQRLRGDREREPPARSD